MLLLSDFADDETVGANVETVLTGISLSEYPWTTRMVNASCMQDLISPILSMAMSNAELLAALLT